MLVRGIRRQLQIPKNNQRGSKKRTSPYSFQGLGLEGLKLMAGVDGILIEVHPNPKVSLSDGVQVLRLENFSKLIMELNAVAHAVDREINLTGNVD